MPETTSHWGRYYFVPVAAAAAARLLNLHLEITVLLHAFPLQWDLRQFRPFNEWRQHFDKNIDSIVSHISAR